MELNGQKLYCRVTLIGDTYYICAVPASDMAASRNVTVAVILFVFFVVMATVALYGVFVMRQEERDGTTAENFTKLGHLRFNRVIGKRAAVFAVVGLIAIVLVSFYMQTLFALSSQSVTNKEPTAQVAETISRTNDRADDLTEQYNERYLSKARVATYILERNPELANKAKMQELADALQIDRVLDGVKAGTSGFAFAVNKDDVTLAYYPDPMVQGKDATKIGLTEDQLTGDYNDYLTLEGQTYYAASVETSDYYVYVAGSEGELMSQRIPLTITTGIIALACMALIYCLLTLEPASGTMAARLVSDDKGDGRVFDIETPSGRRAKTESAASRWLNRSLDWDTMSPEQKLGHVLRIFMAIAVVMIFISVLFRDKIFGSDSVFGYILGGGWSNGLNIFAITASIMTACVIFTVSFVIQKVLHMFSTVLSARGETVCRPLISLTKYGAILGTLTGASLLWALTPQRFLPVRACSPSRLALVRRTW